MYEYYENYGHKIANTGLVSTASAAMPAAFPDGSASDAYKQASRIDPIAEESTGLASEKTENVNHDQGYDASSLEGDEAKVYGLLKEAGKPLLADELSEMCGMDISEMLMLLTDLELEGAVVSSAGQSYTAC